MFVPTVMAVLLALVVWIIIPQTGKYGSKLRVTAAIGVLASIAISDALFGFGPFVTPIPQVIILGLVLHRLRGTTWRRRADSVPEERAQPDDGQSGAGLRPPR
jgi:hypothetical protein